jgi:hypothetical protein
MGSVVDEVHADAVARIHVGHPTTLVVGRADMEHVLLSEFPLPSPLWPLSW